jgi:hypothetical protein
MTLDVRSPSFPSHIIETDDGDLILDRRFQANVYVKGVISSAPASKSRDFKFGYNLANRIFAWDSQRCLSGVKKPTLYGAYGSLRLNTVAMRTHCLILRSEMAISKPQHFEISTYIWTRLNKMAWNFK